MSKKCPICHWKLENEGDIIEASGSYIEYKCPRCGTNKFSQEAIQDLPAEHLSREQNTIISISLRNEYEHRGRTPSNRILKLGDLLKILDVYQKKDPIEKMDNLLFEIDKRSTYVGKPIEIVLEFDYPLYHCTDSKELDYIIDLLSSGEDSFITATNTPIPPNEHHQTLHERKGTIQIKGYQRIRELIESRKDFRQCFVAMWFDPKIDVVFENAIKPAIEFIEEGESEPRFKALRIDRTEHTNDINDEIIAQIRRSRFMVCDLTGYRGGVYFEAGFAYGLGMEVIYTCNKNWINQENYIDDNGNNGTCQ